MFFPLRHWAQVEAQAVQQGLRQAFTIWGYPQHIRFDNGKPWGNPAIAVPTALALWLVGLGIQPIFGRLRQSTDNAVVERCHGVLNGWVEPRTCENLTVLEQRLGYYARLQRELYPLEGGQPRLVQFPALYLNPRIYILKQEESLWDMERVLNYVATSIFTRVVEKNGRMTLMTHEYSLGRQYRSQRVTAQLDPQRKQWVVKDRYGEVAGYFPALQFTYDTLVGLKLTYKHFKAKLNGVQHGV